MLAGYSGAYTPATYDLKKQNAKAENIVFYQQYLLSDVLRRHITTIEYQRRNIVNTQHNTKSYCIIDSLMLQLLSINNTPHVIA